jgi:Tfp pilus assembly protein PilN
MQAVNLLPAYARPGHRWTNVGKDIPTQRVLMLGGVLAAVAMIGFGALYFHERSVVDTKRSDLAEVQARLTAANAQAAPLHAAETASAARLAVVRSVSRGRVPWKRALNDLSRILPGGSSLQSMSFGSPTPIASGTSAAGFTVTGSADSQNRVALVLDRLAILPWLTNVTLQSTSRGVAGTGSGGAADQFSINATVVDTGSGQ